MDPLDAMKLQMQQQLKQQNTSKESLKAEQEKKQKEALQPGESIIQSVKTTFTPEQITELINIVVTDNNTAGVSTSDENHELKKVRRTKVQWLDHVKYDWVYKELIGIARQIDKKYQFGISRVREPIQIALYDESEQGFYDWHMDWGGGSTERKISISVPLNDPSEYEGGHLEFCIDNKVIAPLQAKGTAIVFPSLISHRVMPVTKGKRYSMVIWVQ